MTTSSGAAAALTGLDGGAGLLAIAQEDLNRVDIYAVEGRELDFEVSISEVNGTTLSRPSDLAITADGQIWVADSGNGRIVLVDLQGMLITEVRGLSPTARPSAVDVLSNGDLIAVDADHDRLMTFDRRGEPIQSFELVAPLSVPRGVAASRDGGIAYVIGEVGAAVHAYNLDSGQLVASYAASPTEHPHDHGSALVNPISLDVDPATGLVVVADWILNSVLVFDAGLNHLSSFGGQHGTGFGGFYNPEGTWVDEGGAIWLIDYANHRGQILDQAGRPLGLFAEGRVGLVGPLGNPAEVSPRTGVMLVSFLVLGLMPVAAIAMAFRGRNHEPTGS